MTNLKLKDTYLKDFMASIVVFLVALPLCMGIAMASGVPILYGIISGIIGGIVIGAMTGSPLQVSGPAAGLAVIVFDVVQSEGLAGLAIVTFIGGLFQLLFALLKAGPVFRAISPSVVKGMLAGIGVLIFASQFHVMVDDSPKENAFQNILTIPEAIVKIFDFSQGVGHTQAGILGLITIAIIVGWNFFKQKVKNPVPGPLVAIVFASLAVAFGGLDIQLVELPQNITGALSENMLWKHFTSFKLSYIFSGLMMAFVATTETLLCVTAVDQIKVGHKSNYNQELLAQGVGNSVAGIFGALPITGVIVRTSANVEAGGETKASTFMHGLWLLVALFLFPGLLAYIPKAGLAAILVFTGWKLMDFKAIKLFNQYGRSETAIYLATIGGVVFINLLAGVALGVALSLVRLIWKTQYAHIEVVEKNDEKVISFHGNFSFINLPKAASALEQKSDKKKIVLDLRDAGYIDHAIYDLIEGVHKTSKQYDQQLIVHLNDQQKSQDVFVSGDVQIS